MEHAGEREGFGEPGGERLSQYLVGHGPSSSNEPASSRDAEILGPARERLNEQGSACPRRSRLASASVRAPRAPRRSVLREPGHQRARRGRGAGSRPSSSRATLPVCVSPAHCAKPSRGDPRRQAQLPVEEAAAAQLALFGKDTGVREVLALEREPRRKPWAWLLRQVFDVDVSRCVRCGGVTRWLEAATTPEAIARVLAKQGLRARSPPEVRAKSGQLRPKSGQLRLAFSSA